MIYFSIKIIFFYLFLVVPLHHPSSKCLQNIHTFLHVSYVNWRVICQQTNFFHTCSCVFIFKRFTPPLKYIVVQLYLSFSTAVRILVRRKERGFAEHLLELAICVYLSCHLCRFSIACIISKFSCLSV